MPRKKITNRTQKKAKLLLKRAVKRGDADPEDLKKKAPPPKRRRIRAGGHPDNATAVESAKKLQSAFIKLPPNFLQETRELSASLSLPRPIPDEAAIFHSFDHTDEPDFDTLSCPKRPKWRFDMTKTEVERNEEGNFKKYVAEIDEALEKWQTKIQSEPYEMPRSPSYYERNLEVWRQLWRVSEISQIILVLLDSRCPILHYPPSLSSYLKDRKVILVLTKVDISGPLRVQAWIEYIDKHYPKSRIVQVESYVEKEASRDHQGRKQYEPSVPAHFRTKLVQTIREVHEELLAPPEDVANHPDRLKNWIPPVKREIDWEGVLHASGSKVGLAVGGAAVPHPNTSGLPEGQQDADAHQQEPSYLTIGLIGQPNVGKSSLLNALFGINKVRASKTAGKTKHFQTLYWTPDVRLVDCPGLVMPNYVPLEMQVLCGIIPISRVSAVPSCIHYASQLLPLERIFNLEHPKSKLPPVPDKRTWRDKKVEDFPEEPKAFPWTAMDILVAFADAKGFITAQAGRPDIHRAGNYILRSLAEGRVKWAFWPPGTSPDEIAAAGSDKQGIWIPRADGNEDPNDHYSEDDKGGENVKSSSESDDEEEEEDSDPETSDEDETNAAGVSRFDALAINEDEEDEDEDDEESE